MAETPTTPADIAPQEGEGSHTGLLAGGIALFLIVMGLFGGLSYGFYRCGATWEGLGFFLGLVALFAGLLSSPQGWFGKSVMYALFGIGVVGTGVETVLRANQFGFATEQTLRPLGAMVVLLIILALLMLAWKRSFFGKCNGRIMFSLWLISILGAYFVFLFEQDKYPMGIDLAGGTELIYRLDYSQTQRNIVDATRRLQAERTKDPNSKETRDLMNQVSTLEASIKAAPDKAAEVVRRRIDPTGTKGIPVTTYGADKERLRIQLPRATLEEVKRIKNAIETQGRLTFHIVPTDQQVIEETKKSKTKMYADPNSGKEYELKIIKTPKQYSEKVEFNEEPVVIERLPGMDGSKITLAMARRSTESAGWEIGVRFSPQGQVEFGDMTGKNVQKRMAINLDGTVYSAPTIQEAIHGECRISGRFDQEEAEKLAAVLTAGSLPAEVKYENEFTVGPTLGREQIASGMQATVIGTVAVIAFMLIYYRLSGVIAAFCTALNIIMLLGAMGFFKATLTLPGIAGIVLTLGMSVDANVLILERMREEYNRGRSLRLAVSHGFDRALLTIIDCNLTTLISGIVLYYMGTGPVRGFAVTLSIGILTTLFCNLWVNGVIMEWLVSREAFAKLNMMQFFKTTHIDFMGWRRVWYTITGSMVLVSLVLLVVFSNRLYDVDFAGGTLVQFNFAPGKGQEDEVVKKKMADEVEPAVRKRVQNLVAQLKASLAGTAPQPEAAPKAGEAAAKTEEAGTAARTGEPSNALMEKRIAEIEKSMENFYLQPQAFGAPTKGCYQSFRVTTRATDPGIIEQVDQELLAAFKDELEPPAVTVNDKAIQMRLYESASLTPEAAQARIRAAIGEAARDSVNQDFQDALLALNVSTPETSGGYAVANLTPLPADPKVRDKVAHALELVKVEGRAGGPISLKNSFGAQVAGEMWRDSLLALIVANIGVFIYLWFRFEFSGAWGFGAIVALIHDVIIAAGAVVVANLVLHMSILIDLNIIAALLTIVGFSVNDTIVVFDRIREVKAAHPTRNYEDIVNEAVNATLSRTILTSLTVILADLSLLIFGGPTIRGLAWTLLVGFTVGTYSSIFIASPLMIWWYRHFGAAPIAASAPKQQRTDAPSGAEV
ncbi:MAG: protein translocase subunit SecD [Planctomycetota bacterium]|nr:protein translocase subunit SecD [Planctomycetota bacterium]